MRRRNHQQARMDFVIVDDDVRRLETLHTARRDEIRSTRAGTDQIDNAA
jgi:hypothetical protein